jgi:uncharacterized protein YutE (UPF0331/DUF86 family)
LRRLLSKRRSAPVPAIPERSAMRNVLVHAYLDVDDDKVWDALAHLDDLREFAVIVQRFEVSS